jgi:N-methylhydantoinase B
MRGQVVRVVTTGGGGWGDPLAREPELVLKDAIEGRVSAASASDDYGVVLVKDDDDGYAVDGAATVQKRAALLAKRPAALPMIDRGEGFEKMLRGECEPRMR